MGHPITVDELIASLRDDSPAPARSAEASLVARLSEVREKTAAAVEAPEDNYDSLSLEELTQLASQRVGTTEVVEESATAEKKAEEVEETEEVEAATEVDTEADAEATEEVAEETKEASDEVTEEEPVAELDKTAEERAIFGAQVAAHAFMQEIELIKQANVLGLCRFCKEAEVIEGQSSCTSCTQEGE